jgi:pyruvate dehydrogenase complex dihydrolipoamide acetyltransferase long form
MPNIFGLILTCVIVVIVFSLLLFLIKRYKKCPSDKVMVIYGKVGSNKDGSTRSAKCIHGGAAFIWPVIQSYEFLDLTPMSISVDLENALSRQNIRINVPSRFTVGVSTEPGVMQNAAERLLGLKLQEIQELAKDIIFGQLRLVIATMDIEEINTDRDKFLEAVSRNVEGELKKIGLRLINVNVTDISDESGYIDALGKEAAAKAINDAKKNVAEKDRDGSIGEAQARRDQRIQVAQADASAIQGENSSKVEVAMSNAQRREKEAEATRIATAAEKIAAAQALEEAYAAEQKAEAARAQREKATQEADVIVKTEIDKRRRELEAEAEAEQIRRRAKGEADAILASHVTAVVADAQVEADFDDDEDDEPAEKAAAPAEMGELKLTPRAKKYMKDNGIAAADVSSIQGTGFQGGITERDIKASPLARKLAEKTGVDLSTVQGTGAGEKIMKKDVERAAAAAASSGSDELQIASVVPYKGVRKIIGDKLAHSKFTAPHLYFTDAVDTTNLTAFRKQLNENSEVRIAVSDLLIMAACKALKKFPGINVTLKEDQIVTYKSINIGTAVAGDNGLVVPVVKNVQNKSLTDVAAESKDLVARAKEGRLKPEEYSNGTFSISNLGMFGIGNFTAIINAPEAAILSVSSVRKTPVVITDENGEDTIAIRPMMNIQLSVDHRLIDGLLASQFVEYMKQLLENPVQILM